MPDRKPTEGPLQGIRLLDLPRLLPGPLGTMLMADMGAEVIKVESPAQPDYVRIFPPHINGESVNYLAYNRSKRSLLLDYTTDEGRATFLELVRTADVVVEQFRPGYLDRLGLGYEAARAVNPEIIYVSVTGYGQTGPYAHWAGHDLNYTAIAGVLGLTGDRNGDPMPAGVQLADIAGGSYMTVIATLAALHARRSTGLGQHVDVSMTDAVMPLLAVSYAQYAATGQSPQRGTLPLAGGLPNYSVYRCSDHQFIALGALEPKFWQRFCTVIQQPDWMDWLPTTDPEILHRARMALKALFAGQPRAYWTRLARVADLPLTPVNDLAELADDPQLRARRMILETEHPRAGKLREIGVPLQFSLTPARPAWPAPQLGEDTEAILRELEESNRRIGG